MVEFLDVSSWGDPQGGIRNGKQSKQQKKHNIIENTRQQKKTVQCNFGAHHSEGGGSGEFRCEVSAGLKFDVCGLGEFLC